MKRLHVFSLARIAAAVAVLVLALGAPAVVSACDPSQQSCTSNYGVSETHFGTGGQLGACSTGGQYCADLSAGELGIGNSASSSSSGYQANAGSGLSTNRQPSLELDVGGAAYNAGTLSTGSTNTVMANFSVKTYLADGYTIQIYGTPPTSTGAGTHTFTAMNTLGVSQHGVEQFGINLRQNTSPAVGAEPLCNPSGFCKAYTVQPNYDTVNQFYYPNPISGTNNTLVTSNSSTGEIDFTISFIYNISNITPDGQYTYNGDIVATSTF